MTNELCEAAFASTRLEGYSSNDLHYKVAYSERSASFEDVTQVFVEIDIMYIADRWGKEGEKGERWLSLKGLVHGRGLIGPVMGSVVHHRISALCPCTDSRRAHALDAYKTTQDAMHACSQAELYWWWRISNWITPLDAFASRRPQLTVAYNPAHDLCMWSGRCHGDQASPCGWWSGLCMDSLNVSRRRVSS